MSAEHAAICEKYVELVGSADGLDELVGLFAEGATVEDPIGAEPKRGLEEIRAFYATLPDTGVSARLIGPVHAVGGEAAFPFVIDTAGFEMNVIDTFVFDENDKITSMRAFWHMA